MKDKLQITIRLVNLQEPLGLQIDRDEEEIYRKAETKVNDLWAELRQAFGKKSSEELFAMVAYEFATRYLRVEKSEEVLKQLETAFDDVIHNMKPIEAKHDAPTSR
jgi:hypothetical protein